MRHGNTPFVQSSVFTLRTIPLDLLALGSLGIVALTFVPTLQAFNQHDKFVTADTMTFSLLSFLCLFYVRVLIALLSIVRGAYKSRILAVACIVSILATMVPHLFQQPLLIAWAHHRGYELDHSIQDYRETKLVFKMIGKLDGASQPDM